MEVALWSLAQAAGSGEPLPSSWRAVDSTRWRRCATQVAQNDLGSLAGRTLSTARMDVTDPSSFVIPADLRVLVNNAGVDSEYLPVEHSNLADWRSLFETNVLGTVSVTAAAIPTLRSNRPAVVCNITSSSILGERPFLLRLPCDEGRRIGFR